MSSKTLHSMSPESIRASTPIALIVAGGLIAIVTLVLAGLGKLSDVSITAGLGAATAFGTGASGLARGDSGKQEGLINIKEGE